MGARCATGGVGAPAAGRALPWRTMPAPKIVHYLRNPHLKPAKPHLFRLTDCGQRARGRAVSECIYFVTCARCWAVINRRMLRAREERLRESG